MHTRAHRRIWALACWLAAWPAWGEESAVFRFRSEHGAVNYSNQRPSGPFQVVKSTALPDRPAKGPAAVPDSKVRGEMIIPTEVQRSRDLERYQILSDELSWTRETLERARARRLEPAQLHRYEADIAALLRELERTRQAVSRRVK